MVPRTELFCALERWTGLSPFGGAAVVSSTFEQVVPIDPALLALRSRSWGARAAPVGFAAELLAY
ncbi:MAG: hypothetical protein WDO73_19860 [Ignavibacteriota bacterium]